MYRIAASADQPDLIVKSPTIRQSRSWKRVGQVFLTCAAAGVLIAATPSTGPGATTEVSTEIGDGQGTFDIPAAATFELSLENAIVFALEHNLGLAIERYEHRRSLLGIVEAMGVYDLQLGAFVSTASNSSPTTSALEEVATAALVSDSDVWNFSLDQLTPLGGTGSLDFDNSRFESSNRNVQPNPQFGTDLTFAYTQPLLRNFGKLTTERQILIAKTNSLSSLQSFRSQIEGVIQQVAQGYWNLTEAREQLAVSRESLKLARELHEMNRIQVEVGTLAPIEMVQSEAGVARQEQEIIILEASVEDTADTLRQLMNLQAGPLWDIPIEPTTDPEIGFEAVDLAEQYQQALAHRSDLEILRLDLDNRDLDARVAGMQTKPQLDLSASYGFEAVAGRSENPETGDIINDGYQDAVEELLEGDFDGWRVQLTFGYPLQNRAAKARALQAEIFRDQGDVELRSLEQQILLDVRRAVRDVETAAKRIESSEVSSRLARENLNAEQQRYQNGLSTSFQVLEIQEDLSLALSDMVSAVVAYRQARIALQASTGRLLDAHNVEIEVSDDMVELIDDSDTPPIGTIETDDVDTD